MTLEEALVDFKENIKPVVGGQSMDMAIEALEKQIPKKPHENTIGFNCPVCFNSVYGFNAKQKFCSECGQRILWES